MTRGLVRASALFFILATLNACGFVQELVEGDGSSGSSSGSSSGGFVFGTVTSCPRPSSTVSTFEDDHGKAPIAWAADFNAVPVTEGVTESLAMGFNLEFIKFPENLRVSMRDQGVRVNLIQGQGVTDDPSWAFGTNTPDGRSWSDVPGSGGSLHTPTRIVVNRLYSGHGSVNLVLHEHGHALSKVLHGAGKNATNNSEFMALMTDTAREAITDMCGSYCSNQGQEEEAYAEMFAYFYACDSARERLTERIPEMATFFQTIEDRGI